MKNQNKDWYAVIMAGGSGERFWPLSRKKTPKQLLKLLGNKSFLQQCVDRILPLIPKENIFVITNEEQLTGVKKQLSNLPAENIIAEPCGRDTCAAVTLGAALVGARSTKAVMAVLPADHIITEDEKFRQVLSDSLAVAGRGQVIVTIGIKPNEPNTGFGYIKVGEHLPEPQGLDNIKTTFHKAEQFVEKPSYDRAVEYLKSGNYRWNAGMFIWSFVTITEGLKNHQPIFYDACRRWFEVATNSARLKKLLKKDYPELKKISIDYALMEYAQNVVVADGDFGWDDLGSWTALSKHLKQDESGNCAVGEFVHIDGLRNLVYDARTKKKTLIGAVGIRDAILVLTDDAVLIAHKSQAQRIKELVKKLAEDKKYKKLL